MGVKGDEIHSKIKIVQAWNGRKILIAYFVNNCRNTSCTLIVKLIIPYLSHILSDTELIFCFLF